MAVVLCAVACLSVLPPGHGAEVTVSDPEGDAYNPEHDYTRAVYRNGGDRITVKVKAPGMQASTTGWLNVMMTTRDYAHFYYVRIFRYEDGSERIRLYDISDDRIDCTGLRGGFQTGRHAIVMRLPRRCLPTHRRGGWRIHTYGAALDASHGDDATRTKSVPYN